MAITITRRIHFCAGHRLLNHDGRCKNLHGHNYVADFYITATAQDDIGRVMDFKELKNRTKGWLDEHWDHAFVLWDRDENAINAIKMSEPHRLYLLPYNPTAENMAKYLVEEVCPQILDGTGGRATKVVIWESPESCAEVSIDED
jgi:6-pyruvoyltetrahydropterin/6-carboxytetrahydropterin synthase